jgi:uncharacterized membrane protein/protein-disulfide isomerase
MRSPAVRSALVVLLTAVGLFASGALLVDYTTESPVFCAEGGGCDALKQTAFAHPLGVPLPFFGLLGFMLLAVLAITRGRRVRQVNLLVAGFAGVVGLGLLVTQVALGHLCPYCVAVDTVSVLLGAAALHRHRREWDAAPSFGPAALMFVVFGGAIAAPVGLAYFHKEPIPRVIAEELAATPKGKVTIVDFVDFECPFCREMQSRLGPALAADSGHFRVLRKMMPLTRIHPHALAAAKAACCGEALGKGDAMADALFETKIEDLTPEGCEHLAVQLGLPLDAYRACLDSPETEARLARDRQEFLQAAAKGDGLPLMWVGEQKLMGARDDATIARVLGEAIARAGS